MKKESSLTTTKKHKNLERMKDGCQAHQLAMKLNQNRPVDKNKEIYLLVDYFVQLLIWSSYVIAVHEILASRTTSHC